MSSFSSSKAFQRDQEHDLNMASSISGREACLGFYVGEVPPPPNPRNIPKILVVGLSNVSIWKKTNLPLSPTTFRLGVLFHASKEGIIWMMDEIHLSFLRLVYYSFSPPPAAAAVASLSAPAICLLHELHVRILRTQKKKKRWRWRW
jgi:hypothetical protein